MKKVTRWFIDEKPVHVGVYQRDYPDGVIRYCWWNREKFAVGHETAELAARYRFCLSPLHDLPWRGLAEKPV